MLLPLVIAASVQTGNHSLRFSTDAHRAIIPYQKQLDILGELTLEAWVFMEPKAHERHFNYVISRNYLSAGYGLVVQGGARKTLPGDTTAFPEGRWVHMAFVRKGPVWKIYVDGELVQGHASAPALQPIELAMTIGNSNFHATPGDQPTPWLGSIDEVRLWKVARSQAQIRRTMKRYLRGNEKGLAAYFPFDEGKGQILHDWTGRLMSGHLGTSYQPDDSDPEWVAGVPLSGRRPRMRVRR